MAGDLTPDAVDLALLRALIADGSLTAKEAGERAGICIMAVPTLMREVCAAIQVALLTASQPESSAAFG